MQSANFPGGANCRTAKLAFFDRHLPHVRQIAEVLDALRVWARRRDVRSWLDVSEAGGSVTLLFGEVVLHSQLPWLLVLATSI